MEYFFLRHRGVFTRIHTKDVLYIEGCRNYIKVVTVHQSYLCLVRMKVIEQTLPADTFIRIHKSYIIPKEKVTGFNKDTVFIGDLSLPVGNLYQSILHEHFFILEREIKQSYETQSKGEPGHIKRQPFNWPLEAVLLG